MNKEEGSWWVMSETALLFVGSDSRWIRLTLSIPGQEFPDKLSKHPPFCQYVIRKQIASEYQTRKKWDTVVKVQLRARKEAWYTIRKTWAHKVQSRQVVLVMANFKKRFGSEVVLKTIPWLTLHRFYCYGKMLNHWFQRTTRESSFVFITMLL